MGTGVIRKKLTDEEIVNLLKRGPLTTHQVSQRIGRSMDSTRKTLDAIADKGLIESKIVEDEYLTRKINLWSLKK